MTDVYIGIGSNLGNRRENIEKACARLEERYTIVRKSEIYETVPVGFQYQNLFLNCVVHVETDLGSMELLRFLQKIEDRLKRTRIIKNGPRIIDLDILFYGNRVIDTDELTVPHPQMHKRTFVLAPLNEIAPDFVHPMLKKTVRELLKEVRE